MNRLLGKQHTITWFVSRHAGSIDWIKQQAIQVDRFVTHLNETDMPQTGDIVIGTLPVHLIAKLNKKGIRFIHLQLEVDHQQRGVELSSQCLSSSQATLQEYLVMKVDNAAAT